MNWVLTKKRLRCWASQGKSHFCKGEQSTWDLKPARVLGTGLGSWKDLASSGRWSSRNFSLSTSLALLPWARPASDLIVQLSYRVIQPLMRKKKQAALWAFIPSPWFQAQGHEGGRSLSLIYQTTFPFRDPDLSFCPLVCFFFPLKNQECFLSCSFKAFLLSCCRIHKAQNIEESKSSFAIML